MGGIRLGLIAVTMLVVLTLAAHAATIHGTVYNIDLNPVKNARVEIDTHPRQVLIARDGTYAFTVPRGTYVLTAKLVQNGTVTALAAEQVSVDAEGDYVIDLLLFPEVDELSDILNITDQIDIDEADFNGDRTWWYVGIGVLVLIVIIGWYLYRRKARPAKPVHEKPAEPEPGQAHAAGHLEEKHAVPEHIHHEEPAKEVAELPKTERDDAAIVVEFIRQQGGRTTQKDIRKHSPLSEAKISLIISELEHKGIIEKIKKGRGNIIVLK